MNNHTPENYHCPFCQLATGVDLDQDHSLQSDVIYKDDFIVAFIARDAWPNNPGHVLIAPIKHHENLYDLPDDLVIKVHLFEKRIAIAIKNSYESDGVSSRQHNEPGGGQDVWHYHLAVFPRYKNDELYLNTYKRDRLNPEERKKYADKLRGYLEKTQL